MKPRSIDGNKKTGKILFEAGILILTAASLCAVGIRQSVLHDWKVASGGRELFFQAFVQSDGKYVITYLNQESIYISFLSVLFSFLGNKEELVSIINLILQLAGAGFFYWSTKKLFHFVFPLAIAVIAGLLSVCFYPVITDSAMHMIWFLSGFIFWAGTKIFCDFSGKTIKWIILGILLGVSCYMDIAGLFLLIAFILFTLIAPEFDMKEKGIQFLWLLLSSMISFFCMFCLWNSDCPDAMVFNQWLNNKIKYFMQADSLNQYISIIVILVICIVFYAITRLRNASASSTDLDLVFQQIVEQEENMLSETEEDTVPEELPETEPEIKKPIKFIENPLPLPKKHVKKEMNYAFEPTKDQMHYDLNNYRLDDDYDLKDL